MDCGVSCGCGWYSLRNRSIVSTTRKRVGRPREAATWTRCSEGCNVASSCQPRLGGSSDGGQCIHLQV